MGALNDDLRRVLRKERQGEASVHMVFALRADHAHSEPLHAPDQQARLIEP
jgi:hypothetical protein